MQIKKIEYIISDFITPFIKQNYPLYVEFLTLFGRYLDQNNYGKIIYIDDNFDPYTIFSELLDLYLDEFFTQTFDENIYGLTDNNKERFIDLSIRINKIKGKSQSFQVLLQTMADFTFATGSGNISVDDVGVINITESTVPEDIFNYTLYSSSPDIQYVNQVIETVHPAGMLRETLIGLFVTTTGSSVDFEYVGTASFLTRYSDGQEEAGANPSIKNFGTDDTRITIISVDPYDGVTSFDLSNNSVISITNLDRYTNLETLYLNSTLITESPDVTQNTNLSILLLFDTNITEPPDVTQNADLIRLYLNDTLITESPDVTQNGILQRLYLYNTNITEPPDVTQSSNLLRLHLNNTLITEAPDVTNRTLLVQLYLNDCNITEASLSTCIDQLYVNRIILGGNSCIINVTNNNGLTADAQAKINGTSPYTGDGLIQAGCLVFS